MNSSNTRTMDVPNDTYAAQPYNLSATNQSQSQPLEALDEVSQLVLMALYSTTSVVSLITNSLVIFVLVFGRKSSPELKLFLINLAVSDICMAALSIPFTYTDFMLGRWVFPKFLCKSRLKVYSQTP